MSGAAVISRDNYEASLKDAIYPGGSRHPVDALTPRAMADMAVLAANPDRLLAFDMLRSVMGRVTGNPYHLLNPVAALCPLHGGGCHLQAHPQQEGQVRLLAITTSAI